MKQLTQKEQTVLTHVLNSAWRNDYDFGFTEEVIAESELSPQATGALLTNLVKRGLIEVHPKKRGCRQITLNQTIGLSTFHSLSKGWEVSVEGAGPRWCYHTVKEGDIFRITRFAGSGDDRISEDVLTTRTMIEAEQVVADCLRFDRVQRENATIED